MTLRVSGKNISIGAALQQKITNRVEEATSKYFRGGYSGHATVGKDGLAFARNAYCTWIPALCSKPREWRQTPMTAPSRLRFESKNSCGATSAAAKINRAGAAAKNAHMQEKTPDVAF